MEPALDRLSSPIRSKDSDAITSLNTSLNESISQVLNTLSPNGVSVENGIQSIRMSNGKPVRVDQSSSQDERSGVLSEPSS